MQRWHTIAARSAVLKSTPALRRPHHVASVTAGPAPRQHGAHLQVYCSAQDSSAPSGGIDWKARRKQRTLQEMVEVRMLRADTVMSHVLTVVYNLELHTHMSMNHSTRARLVQFVIGLSNLHHI